MAVSSRKRFDRLLRCRAGQPRFLKSSSFFLDNTAMAGLLKLAHAE
jgi:hypothetical protein